MKKIAAITITFMLLQMLTQGVCFAKSIYGYGQGLDCMLSPAIQIDDTLIYKEISESQRHPAFNPKTTVADLIVAIRQKYEESTIEKTNISAWPRFFLKANQSLITNAVHDKLQRLIQWMESDAYQAMNETQRLHHIRTLSSSITPFEKILFYEGIYFAPSNSSDLGFGVTLKRDWAVLYFYNNSLFAHGSRYLEENIVEVTFGDDLARRFKEHIPEVHFYAYMKKLMNDLVATRTRTLVVPEDQLVQLAGWINTRFLAQTLNFYLIKVGGFVPQHEPENEYKQQEQQEYISQMRRGIHINYEQANIVINGKGLIRNIAQEEQAYWDQVRADTQDKQKILGSAIKSRQLIKLSEEQIFRMDYIEHPIEITDKTVIDDIGHCAGMIIASGKRLWFRRYAEESYIMNSLSEDLKAANAAEIFNADTKIVFTNTSYGIWRFYFEELTQELVSIGVKPENIIMQDWDSISRIDRVSVYLFPGGQVVLHKKNFDLGVVKVIRYRNYLENQDSPDEMDRSAIENILQRTKLEELTPGLDLSAFEEVDSSNTMFSEQAI